ncbi:MAG TPA: Uma2 family endonuclease [Isosphaeraceae bacterium]|nr:Uma2 family endonuclease [Isosphaeraceae bacterium]
MSAPNLYRITVDEYERIGAAGVLDDDRVELIDGFLVRKLTEKPPHVWTVETIEESLAALLPQGWFIRQEKPVRIPAFDEPEPDLSVIRGSRDDYLERHPEPKDVALLVDVADSSLDRDQGKKLLAYAKGGIPVYWIVNLVERQVEVYSDPAPKGYQSRKDFKSGQDLPVIIEGVEVARIIVADILPNS